MGILTVDTRQVARASDAPSIAAVATGVVMLDGDLENRDFGGPVRGERFFLVSGL